MAPQLLRQTKGETTRALILEAAVQQASEGGFESITIGTLAERTKLSKSGLFAHFGSRQELQIAAMDEAGRRFTEAVFLPALKAPRGLKRMRALFEGWVRWPEMARLSGSCPLYAAAAEYDDKPGSMRDAVVERQALLARELAKTVHMAIETGELDAHADPEQIAFEMIGIVLAMRQSQGLMGDGKAASRAAAAFNRLVDSALATKSEASTSPAAPGR
jgi:AcrR family transcriptional regulator